MIVSKACRKCQKIVEIEIDVQDFFDWSAGDKLIQDAFPYLTAGEREMLISQTCDDCWNKLFACENDDEDLDNLDFVE
jgi:hypothetical protein